jgi:L-asparaginase
MKRILLLGTGGTIASVDSSEGYKPGMDIPELMEYVPEVKGIAKFTYKSILNLDSSNIQPEEWEFIAEEIHKARETCDAIVITHGTDTMAYTASVLSFLLMGIEIPIVITGSQIPINEPYSDGPGNLRDAILTADSGISAGVYIVFNGDIILGCRATKFRTQSFNAFESVNIMPIGRVERGKVRIFPRERRAFPRRLDAPPFKLDSRVFLLKLIPGTMPEFFQHFIQLGYKGLVIECFGIGGLHFLRRDLPKEIEHLIQSGVEVVIISQCPLEISDLTKYETGRKAGMEGVIPGKDMSCEAAVTKLMWAIANKEDGSSVKEMMLRDYCGEISEE